MNQSSFNVVQLALVVVLVTAGAGLAVGYGDTAPRDTDQETVVDALLAARTAARRMQNSTQLRGIHQGLIIYAQSNKSWYPGVDSRGDNTEIEVESRFEELLKGEFFTPEYIVSPSETKGITPWDEEEDEAVTAKHYSYAMLQVQDQNGEDRWKHDGRRGEWRETLNSQAVVLSDRNIGDAEKTASIHSNDKHPSWRGGVLWNDNHVGFEDSDTQETKYGRGDRNETDKLFEADNQFDALLIHSGN